MPNWVVTTLRWVLGIALVGSVLVQGFSIWLTIIDDDPMPLRNRLPIIALFLLGTVCLQIIGVNIWKLVAMVREGTVFTPRAFRHIHWVIGALVGIAVLILAFGVIAAEDFFLPGEDFPPGLVLLIGGAAFVVAGVALVVHVMKLLLRQAIETHARADHLQSELDEVI